jgi:hypothetical protein
VKSKETYNLVHLLVYLYIFDNVRYRNQIIGCYFEPLRITPLKPGSYYAPPCLKQKYISHFDPHNIYLLIPYDSRNEHRRTYSLYSIQRPISTLLSLRVKHFVITCNVDADQVQPGPAHARFFSEYLGFTLVSFHQGCIIAFLYKTLFPEGQVGHAWKPSKTNALFENSNAAQPSSSTNCSLEGQNLQEPCPVGNRGALDRRILSGSLSSECPCGTRGHFLTFTAEARIPSRTLQCKTLSWIKWQRETFYSKYFGFPPSLSLYQFSIHRLSSRFIQQCCCL